MKRALTGFAALAVFCVLAAGAVPATAARSAPPRVVLGTAAALAPDGRSVTLDVLASCDERATVVEASVAFSQPQASGRASFPLSCTGSFQSFRVTVPSAGAAFDLGEGRGVATVAVKRGRIERVQDSQAVIVQPNVVVELADTARLESSGNAVTIDVTVACPVGATGVESYVNVSQGQLTSGTGFYVPQCDGRSHTFSVLVPAARGVYQPGAGQALTFATVEVEPQGHSFTGVDENTQLQIVSP